MRRFLYFVAAMTVLVLAGAFVYRVYERELTEFAFVPARRIRSPAGTGRQRL